MLEKIGLILQMTGVPLALIGLWLSSRSAARSQDLQVILNFVDSFREKWENGWADLLDRLEAQTEASVDPLSDDANRRELTYVLNWIDWVGNLAKSGFLRQENVIIQSINHALIRAIKAGQPIIDEDIKEHGEDYWAGITFVKGQLKID